MDTFKKKDTSRTLDETLDELIPRYNSLLRLIQKTNFYLYQTQKYGAYIKHCNIQSIFHTPPPGPHQIPYMSRHGSEYHIYYKEMETHLAWWIVNSKSIIKGQFKLQKHCNNKHEDMYDLAHIIECFKSLEFEWAIWDQLEQYLYPKNTESNLKAKWDPENCYFLLSQLAYTHQSIKKLFALKSSEFEQVLNQHMQQQLTYTINEYVSYYHQSTPDTLYSSTSDDLGKKLISDLAHIIYYWPFPDTFQKDTTEEHIAAKQVLSDIAQGLQQRFPERINLKHTANCIHPWITAQFTSALIPFMADYAETHVALDTQGAMISIGFFKTPSPTSLTDYANSAEDYPSPSPVPSSEGTNIEC